MFKLKIYRDPTADAGGAAAPTVVAPSQPSQPAQPAHNGPLSYGGSSMEQLWEDPIKSNPTQPQPPVTGNKTPAAPAVVEGGGQGSPAQGGTPAPDTRSTAPENGQPPAEVKGALSPDDKAYWSKKDPAFTDLPDHPAVAKMSSQYRELEGKFTQGQQYLGVVNQTIEDFKSVLAGGNPAEIAKMVEHFGGEVKFDTRGPAELIKEAREGYTSLVQALQAVVPELPPGSIPVLEKALANLHLQTEAKVSAIEQKQTLKTELQALAKAAGIVPQIGNPNERYKAPAQANMTQLEREWNDPDFWKYYEEIKPEFAPGGMYHAQGITAGKAFGSSIASAKFFMNQAKGIWLQKNMPTVLSQHEQAWLKKQQGNSAAGAPPRGASPANAGAAPNPTIAALEARMADHMQRYS